MNNLVLVKNNDTFTNSIIIANGTGNRHKNVKELIVKYQTQLKALGTLSVSNGESSGGRPEQYYLLNEPQATFLITLLKNTKIVVDFKLELVKQFYAMRKFILEKQSKEWQETRKNGILTRKAETSTIKQLVEYAKKQGSKNSDKLYMTYSKLANKIIGVNKRDTATIMQLNNLSLAENIILHCIENGIKEGKHYKEIYQDSKKRLDMFKDIAFIEMHK